MLNAQCLHVCYRHRQYALVLCLTSPDNTSLLLDTVVSVIRLVLVSVVKTTTLVNTVLKILGK